MDFVEISSYFSLFLFLLLIFMGLFLLERTNRIAALRGALSKLRNAFTELDEQAKLIVKTDLELNKAQEELDKRLNGLDMLQQISRSISTTLDEQEIFQRLDEKSLTQLGFEKFLILTFDVEKKLTCRVSIGFPTEMVEAFLSWIERNADFLDNLNERQVLSSARETSLQDPTLIKKSLNIRHFVIAPLLAQKELLGIILGANRSDAFKVTEGDEEILSILADQIGISIENARLFEQAFRSSQMLEVKVQERTKQLSSALNEVQEISNTKSEFISAVSHELRTPLTSIKGYASLLITGKIGQIPEKVKERLEKINTHSDNLVKLINDLLDISRIESGKHEMRFSPHTVQHIVDNVHDLLTPQLKERNLTLTSILPPDCPRVPMDVSQIERVLINLVNNAIKFSPQGGKITVRGVLQKEIIAVSVIDQGIGIAPENVNKLFNEFYRVENEINQNVKGTGLGLALSKKIVEAHNGSMTVISEVGKGANFTFTLPLKQNTNRRTDSA